MGDVCLVVLGLEDKQPHQLCAVTHGTDDRNLPSIYHKGHGCRRRYLSTVVMPRMVSPPCDSVPWVPTSGAQVKLRGTPVELYILQSYLLLAFLCQRRFKRQLAAIDVGTSCCTTGSPEGFKTRHSRIAGSYSK